MHTGVAVISRRESMANFGRFYVPPFSAAVNVVWAAVKSYVPENSPCVESIMKRRAGGTESTAAAGAAAAAAGADGPEQAERSRLQSAAAGGKSADTNPFRTTCNSELSSYGGVEKRGGGVAVGDGGGVTCSKRTTTPQAFSMDDGSFDEDSSGGGEFGRSRHKIDEWQAAWNVTNAIQVSNTYTRYSYNIIIAVIVV